MKFHLKTSSRKIPWSIRTTVQKLGPRARFLTSLSCNNAILCLWISVSVKRAAAGFKMISMFLCQLLTNQLFMRAAEMSAESRCNIPLRYQSVTPSAKTHDSRNASKKPFSSMLCSTQRINFICACTVIDENRDRRKFGSADKF